MQKKDNIKNIFYRRTKASNFNIGDKVLKWDSRREDKGKHGKFDNLWLGPYFIHSAAVNNAFFLQELNGAELFGGPVNGRMLKHYFSWTMLCSESLFMFFLTINISPIIAFKVRKIKIQKKWKKEKRVDCKNNKGTTPYQKKEKQIWKCASLNATLEKHTSN